MALYQRPDGPLSDLCRPNRSLSPIPQFTCSVSQNVPFRTEIHTFLSLKIITSISVIWDRLIINSKQCCNAIADSPKPLHVITTMKSCIYYQHINCKIESIHGKFLPTEWFCAIYFSKPNFCFHFGALTENKTGPWYHGRSGNDQFRWK